MKSLWQDSEAKNLFNDPLKLCVYASQLLGHDSNLVLHGGGNTSVKSTVKNLFGESEEVLYIKGSGWDLATIKEAGFAPVKLDVLKRMAALKELSDPDMVKWQRAAMLNPNAPNPSVEAILHAIIPYQFVLHSHADVIAAITNTPNGAEYIKEIYGNRILIVPYVMPGFVLARKIYEMTQSIDWTQYEGMVLLNHGLFTFAHDAKASYVKHIELVSKAENFITKKKIKLASHKASTIDLLQLATIRKAVSQVWGKAVIARLNNDAQHVGFSMLSNLPTLTSKGTLTPDHVIRTKPTPVVIKKDIVRSITEYATDYKTYFNKHADTTKQCLDLAPRWAVWPAIGTISFGLSFKDAAITNDIVDHTIPAIQWADQLGGWKPISKADLFEMEYWVLEQAKLASTSKAPTLQGQIALVTGAASGIGKACVERLLANGACVAALDINQEVETLFKQDHFLGITCDVTKNEQLNLAIETTVRAFGGLDIIVSNAGMFPPSETLNNIQQATWAKSMAINLTSHQELMTLAIAYLAQGINPSIIVIASKNVPAPGPGAGAYSVAKAGLTQMARVAALELGQYGIRVNVLHPNQVFDTAIWTDEVLKKRAASYGLSVSTYKTNNILKTEIVSKDVAELVISLAGPAFAKTTGAQIPIDGGNERVI